MMLKKVIILFFCMAIVVFAAFPQEAETGELTIEEMYLMQDIELQIIRNQVLSNEREIKYLALQNIRAMLEGGKITEDNPSVLVLLDALAQEGLGRVITENGRIINNFPDVRREAVALLGEIGGEKAKATLKDVLMEDNEPMVLAEAVYALGKVGSDQGDQVIPIIGWVLKKETSKMNPDNNFAFSSLLAIEKIAAAGGDVSDPELINAILEVAAGNYIKAVRLKAIDVIYKLRKG